MDIALTKVELTVVVVGGIVMLLAAGMVGATVLADSPEQSSEHDNSSHENAASQQTQTPPANLTESEQASASKPVAVSLAKEMEQRGMSGKVLIHPETGAILVEVQPETAGEVKPAFYEVGMMYGEVLTEHPEYSEVLTIRTNGVYAQVSPDAARAYGEGRLQPDAFNETVAIQSESTPTEDN